MIFIQSCSSFSILELSFGTDCSSSPLSETGPLGGWYSWHHPNWANKHTAMNEDHVLTTPILNSSLDVVYVDKGSLMSRGTISSSP